MEKVKSSGVVKASCSVLLCAPEILTLMPKLIGFNAFSSSVAITSVILCFVVSIGLAISAVRKGNDAAWALGFLALAIHVGFLGKFLSPTPAPF